MKKIIYTLNCIICTENNVKVVGYNTHPKKIVWIIKICTKKVNCVI